MGKKKHIYKRNKSVQKIKTNHRVLSNYNPHKKRKDCKFYNPQEKICLKKDIGFNKCQGAYACSMFRLKSDDPTPYEHPQTDGLSDYDDTYLEVPMQEYIHQTSGSVNPKQSNRLGTFAHVGYLKSNNTSKYKRRDKRACIYYEKNKQFCKIRNIKCFGATHCKKYVHR